MESTRGIKKQSKMQQLRKIKQEPAEEITLQQELVIIKTEPGLAAAQVEEVESIDLNFPPEGHLLDAYNDCTSNVIVLAELCT